MNTFKKALAVMVAAVTLGVSAMTATQASAHDWDHWGHDYRYSRCYDYDCRHDDYGYRHDRYEFRGHDYGYDHGRSW